MWSLSMRGGGKATKKRKIFAASLNEMQHKRTVSSCPTIHEKMQRKGLRRRKAKQLAQKPNHVTH